jgi:hypothetical protein
VTSLDELKLRTVAVIETVTPKNAGEHLEGTDYRLGTLRAKKGAYIEVV